jgi:hypothetical protein
MKVKVSFAEVQKAVSIGASTTDGFVFLEAEPPSKRSPEGIERLFADDLEAEREVAHLLIGKKVNEIIRHLNKLIATHNSD